MVSERGALGLPLALGMSAALIFGLGTWSLLHRYRGIVETQLRLDRCAGEKAQELRTIFERLQLLNRAIRTARLTLAAGIGTLQPQAIAAAKTTLQASALAQETIIAVWQSKRALWLVRGCGHPGDSAEGLPALPWTRDPPDPLGPRPLRWATPVAEFRIRARNKHRVAAAKVYGRTKNEGPSAQEPEAWFVAWSR